MVDSLGIVLSRIIPVFEQLGITYFIGGSVASGAHGEKRQTNDVDIVVDMKPEKVAPLVGLLEKEFYVDEEMILSSLEHRSSFNFIHFETAYKVDLFPVKLRAYDRQVVERSQQHLVIRSLRLKPTLLNQRILSLLNWNGITVPMKHLTDNGMTF